MRILIADKYDPGGIENLKALGCEVVCDPGLGPETIPAAIPGFDILVVRSTKVSAAAIDAGDSLKGIIRAGAGYDNIDLDAAGNAGVSVCNCPGMNAIAVAELAMAMLLCCDRRIVQQTTDLQAGNWRKKEYSKARGLKDSTLGVVGVGAIGKELIQRARAFDMKICVWSRSMTFDKAAEYGATFGGSDRASLLQMLGRCDAVSLHVAATPETKEMCDHEFFAAMKDGAYFVNTARGGVVDESALIDAVASKGIRCGLDVYQNQPPTPEAQWRPATADMTGATFSHHVGASTDQAQRAVSDEVLRIARIFKENGRFENCVNADALGKKGCHA